MKKFSIVLFLIFCFAFVFSGCEKGGDVSDNNTGYDNKPIAKVDNWNEDYQNKGEYSYSNKANSVPQYSAGMNVKPEMMKSFSAADSANIGFSVGGAKDINNFRENIKNDYLPLLTDVTYEGVFYDYYFDRGQNKKCEKLFCPSYNMAFSKDPFSRNDEYFLAVGLNSNIKESDFKRKKLNLMIVMDISGSMGSPFDSYYYDRFGKEIKLDDKEVSNKKKIEIAAKSVANLLDQLDKDDNFGIVLFDDQAYLAKPFSKVEETDMNAIKGHILELVEQGGTNMSAGMNFGTDQFKELKEVNQDEYENRIIFLTDAMPNFGETGEFGLLGMTKDNANNKIYSTFMGMGVDFNTELIEIISKIKGANYYSVHSEKQFAETLDEGFDYMVTPLVFDLNLKMESSGYEILKVYGSSEASEATGEIMKINTLFPSKTEGGETKGGIVILHLKKNGEDGKIKLTVSYEDRNGKKDSSSEEIDFKSLENNSYDNKGIRKGILLSRYVNLLHAWILEERKQVVYDDYKPMPCPVYKCGIIIPEELPPLSMLGKWERQSVPLTVSSEYKQNFSEFKKYLESEMEVIKDDSLKREVEI